MKRSFWLIPAIIAFAVCVPSFGNTFVWDDLHLILNNPKVQEPGALRAALTADFWDTNAITTIARGQYYRPVVKVSHVVLWHLFGAKPLGWHVFNALLHAAVTGLAAVFIARRLSANHQLAAGLAASLWALHPTRVETVAWACGASDELMLLFILLGLLATRWWVSALAFFIAALTKEAAYVLPVLLVSDAFLRGRLRDPKLLAAIGVVVAVATRLVVRGAPAMVSQAETGQRSLTQVFGAFGFYVSKAVWPWSPGALSGAFATLDDGTPLVPTALVVIGASFVVVLMALAASGLRSPGVRPWLADLTWFVVPLLPVVHLVRSTFTGFAAERFLALPLLGIAVVVARLLSLDAFWLRPRVRYAVMAAVCLAFGVVSAAHMRDFRDHEALVTYELEREPTNAEAMRWYAAFAMQERRYDEAVPLLATLLDVPGTARDADLNLLTFASAMRLVTPDADPTTLDGIALLYRGLVLKEPAPTLSFRGKRYPLRQPVTAVLAEVADTGRVGDFHADALLGLGRGKQLDVARRYVPAVMRSPSPNSRRAVISVLVNAWARDWAEAKRLALAGDRLFPSPQWAVLIAALDEGEAAEKTGEPVRRARAWVALKSRRLAREALRAAQDQSDPRIDAVRREIDESDATDGMR